MTDPQHTKVKLWKEPTTTRYLRRALLSESLAWAVQNGVGALFTMLFVVINDMSFTLACIAVCLYAASSQVLSLDRTVGGRLFAGALFLGCVMSAGVLGGGLASLAWLARGSAEGLMELIPGFILENTSKTDITMLQQILPQLAAVPLPGFIRDIFEAVAAELATLERSLFPMPNAAFWALLMVLCIIAILPFAVARADADQKVGLLMAIATLFLGTLIIFGALLPTLGLRLYWTQAVAGYIKVGLVAAGAMTLAALLFFARSSHDEVREQLGRLLQGAGALAGHAGSVAAAPAGEVKTAVSKPHSAMKDKAEIKAAMERDARALAASLMPAAAADLVAADKMIDEEALAAAPAPATALQLRAQAEEVENALAMTLFEPPLWGIASQPGSNRGHYAALLTAIEHVISALGSLDACAADAQRELAASTSAAGRAAQTALALCSASCAASCADVSVALRHMPLKGPCSGPQLSWRPRPAEYWQDLAAALQRAGAALQPDTDGAMAESVFIDGRASVAAVACCEVVLRETEAMEAAAAVALAVASPPPPSDKHALSLKEKISNNAFAPSALVLLAMGLGLPVWASAVKGTVSLCRGTVAFCRSSKRRSEIMHDRGVQFAAKYWAGSSVAMVAIILILWKGEGSGAASPIADLVNLDNFFLVWQPLYAWISVAICLQQYVEASAFRGILRAIMTAVGGTLGYAAMLNGSLAQNAVFVTGIVVAFNAVCSLLSPLRALRYSLFLATLTFNGVVACQYVGCCDVAGDVKVYGGKVLSTLLGSVYALLVSWCFLPYYTSEKMLREEAGALAAGVALVRRQLELAATPDDGGLENAVEEGLRAPLGRVRKDLEANVVDRRQLILTWTVLPTPPVVAPLTLALCRMADLLSAADSVLTSSNLWPKPPGPAQAAMLDALRPDIEAVLTAADATVVACSDCMVATGWKEVKDTRIEISRTLEQLWAARAALRAGFIRWNGEKERPAWTLPDLRFLSWHHLLLLALREVEVCGVLLAEGEASLDRHGYFAWAAAVCGRRPA